MTDETGIAILEELRAIRAALEVNQATTGLTAANVAERFGVSREYVYSHADELGAIRLPSKSGQRGRLRFDLATVAEALSGPDPEPQARRNNSARETELLPIGGNQ